MAKVKLKMKKGDKVIVLTGKDKGKRGEVLKMFPAKGKAIVSGVNRVKRHTRPSQVNPGGIIEKEMPIQISNLAVEDPRDGKATRVGYKFLADGSKVRIAKRSGEMIDG